MDNEMLNRIKNKTKVKIASKNFQNDNVKENKKMNILKMVASFCLAIGITSGLAFASTKVYEQVTEKIWKEPKEYTLDEMKNPIITGEEREKYITEDNATQIAYEWLKKVGFNDDTINNQQLVKEYKENEGIWKMSSKVATINIDATTGDLKFFQIPSYNYKIPYNFGITRIEARKVAWELFEKYKTDDITGDYELVSLKRNMETDEDSYIWYALFHKKYGNLFNEYESVNIGWIPTINGLYLLEFSRNQYENNELKISQDEAIKIAVQKDNIIETKKTIKNVNSEIRIRKMNENCYLRENFKEEYESGKLNIEKTGENTYKYKEDSIFYRTENRVRKVWCVVVEYDVNHDESTMPSYTYYIDSTTGEIIGGERRR